MRDKVKILVVEGEMPVAMLIVHILTCAGFEVCSALNGQKGLQMASEARFDLIMLDTALSDVDTFEICRELRQRHISRCTPIVFIAGQMTEVDKRRSLEMGAQDFIIKPFEADDFIFRISSLIKENHSNLISGKSIEATTV